MCIIKTTTKTTELRAKFEGAVSKLEGLSTQTAYADYVSVKGDADKAKTALNNSILSDVYKSVAADKSDKPIAILAKVGMATGVSYSVGEKGAKISDISMPLSLDGFIKGEKVEVPDAMWRGLVRDAIYIAAYRRNETTTDTDMKTFKDDHDRHATGTAIKDAMEAKRDAEGHLHIDVVQQYIQRAIDGIIMDTTGRDDGQNRYRAGRKDARWLVGSFNINLTTGKTVYPQDENQYARMFIILRHVLAGLDLNFEKVKD